MSSPRRRFLPSTIFAGLSVPPVLSLSLWAGDNKKSSAPAPAPHPAAPAPHPAAPAHAAPPSYHPPAAAANSAGHPAAVEWERRTRCTPMARPRAIAADITPIPEARRNGGYHPNNTGAGIAGGSHPNTNGGIAGGGAPKHGRRDCRRLAPEYGWRYRGQQ